LVTPADVMEHAPLLDQLRRVQFRWHLRPARVVAATTYGTIENIRALADQGIRADVPLADWDRMPYFGPARFAYDAERDAYRCPQGEPLRRHTAKYTEEVVVYRAAPARGNACPLKAACTASEHGRTTQRSCHEAYLERGRAYQETAAYRQARRKRKGWPEPLFAAAKQWHGLRQVRLRGLQKVNMEGLMVAAGQNLKRWLGATGWDATTARPGAWRAPASPSRRPPAPLGGKSPFRVCSPQQLAQTAGRPAHRAAFSPDTPFSTRWASSLRRVSWRSVPGHWRHPPE
jgi:hypothetical protein